MSNSTDIKRLRSMLIPPDGCRDCGCVLDEDELSALLDRYGDLNSAAYHACIRLSQQNDAHMPDGTILPSQSDYWLRMALTFRPNLGRALTRADEVMQ